MPHLVTPSRSVAVVDIASVLLQPTAPPIPGAVHDWLGQTALLFGVPFEHIAPDSRMLPTESIRFFYVDSNWIESLIDGAFSIGVHSDRDIRFHRVLQFRIRDEAAIAAGKLRDRQRGEDDSTPAVPADTRIRAGFLLRSALVSGWPGLEVEAFEGTTDSTPKLKPLRIERLAPDVLIAIFPAIPGLVRLNEPAEGFHFGTSNNTLRGRRDPEMFKGPDQAARTGDEIAVPYRNADTGLGVIDVNSLAKLLGGATHLDSEDFAFQMIDPPDQKAYVGGPAKG